MAYDEELAFRIRALLAAEAGVDEVPMFGGLAFLINDNMAVAVSGKGGIMVHVPPEETNSLLEYPPTPRRCTCRRARLSAGSASSRKGSPPIVS